MTTFVLVHGAWHGSWCWQRVRKALQGAGHDVFTPTLAGVGERSHLASPQVNLSTHVADVVNLVRWEELGDVVLCGHSYGGCVITGAADRVGDRLRLERPPPPAQCAHVLATRFEGSPFPAFHELAKTKGWKTVTIDSGHDVMLDRPAELVELLLAGP